MRDVRSAPNYVTDSGLRRMHQELRALLLLRPRQGVLGTAGERAAQASLGAQIAGLDRRISRVSVPAPQDVRRDRVGFGANVTLRGDDDRLVRLSIVGNEEAAPRQGRLSYTSVTARALEGRALGEELLLRLPRGHAEAVAPFVRYRITGIEYGHASDS